MNLLSIIILLRGDGIHTLSPLVLIELRTITMICEFPIVSRASELSLSKLHSGHSHSGHSHRPISQMKKLKPTQVIWLIQADFQSQADPSDPVQRARKIR